jgi:hypothetical protein
MKTYRNKKYREWVASHPCLRCHRQPCAAHHEAITGRGIGIKAPDTECLPLCNECHRLRHDQGRMTFWGPEWQAFIAREQVRLLTEWMSMKLR